MQGSEVALRAWSGGWTPAADLTPSEWADQRRILSRKASSEHGQWKTSRTPYLREPMDCFGVHDPTQEIVLVFASQTGKALDVETPIATPDGWTTMGELRAGDLVFDDQGRPTRVMHAWPVMHGRPCYRVRFSDGAEIVADKGHRWKVTDRTGGRRRDRVATTGEMLAAGVRAGKGWRFAIPSPAALRLPHAELLAVNSRGSRPRSVVSIDPVPSRPVRCIAVEAPSHLFLAGRELIPTHNSEACNNCIGYAIEVEPGPVLMVQPTLDLAKRYSKMRLAPMIEATPTLAQLVKPSRSRDSGNTLLMKEFLNDALLIIGGANAASGLASMPIRYALEDEVDRHPLDVDGEGSPSDLVDARTRTFGARKKRLKTSTPTLLNQSRIWWEWERSDQRRYHLPCPHCGELQVLSWDMMRYDPQDPLLPKGRLTEPPVMICQSCGTGIEERTKSWWYGEDLGQWIPENPESPVRGYHLPGFYSPLGWLSWTEIVLGHEQKKDDPAKLKTWVNTVLAECWADAGESPDWEGLYRRREPYRRGMVPAGAAVLTCAVDVQRDRLELELLAWGPNLENWSVDYITLVGDPGTIQTDPGKPCVWRDLEREISRAYPHESGGQVPIAMALVDSGDNTNTVYTWVRKQHSARVRAIKGRGGTGQTSPVGLATMQEITYRGKRTKHGVKLWPIGVNVIKQEVYGWLRQPPPLNEGDPAPRGFSHWPDGYGEEYFLGLTAEELQPRVQKGFTVYDWVKVRPRNEPLDLRVYNRAAAWMLGLDRWTEDDWARKLQALGAKAAETEAAVVTPAPRPRRKARRRIAGGL